MAGGCRVSSRGARLLCQLFATIIYHEYDTSRHLFIDDAASQEFIIMECC